MFAAVLVGPISAVLVTLWYQSRRQVRDQRLALLRHLIAFRQLPADANFSHAINMIPIEFADKSAVLEAHREFIQSAFATAVDNQERGAQRAVKQTRLIYEMAHSLGFKIRETDLQTEGYTSTGFVERDLLFQDAQKAWRDIASILWIQTRLLGGESGGQISGSSEGQSLPKEQESRFSKKKG